MSESHHEKDRKKIVRWVLAAVLIFALFATWLIYHGFYTSSRFLSGTSINGINVSGMDFDTTSQEISQTIRDNYSLTVYGRNGIADLITGNDIGLTIEMDLSGAIVENARFQNWFRQQKDMTAGMTVSYEESVLDEVVQSLTLFQEEIASEPEDAYISYDESTGFTIVPEEPGARPIATEVAKEIGDAITAQSEMVVLSDNCYEPAAVTASNPALTQVLEDLQNIFSASITYQFGADTERLDSTVFASWIEFDSQTNTASINPDAASAWLKDLAARTDTAYTERTFTVDGEPVTVSGPYGYQIDQEAERERMTEELLAGSVVSREPEYAIHAASREDELGTTFIEVDLTNQHVRLFVDGTVLVESDCVTGNLANGNGTPDGIYPITYKQRNAVLRGQGYETPVSYWMPFNRGIGLHDATWRGRFGGSIYKTNGSHGCVNLPLSAAKSIFEYAYAGMPVLCHY